MSDSRCSFFVMTYTSLHFIGDFLTEQARGLDAEDHDQQRERECVGERGIADALDQLFAQADDERTDHRAGDRADAAEKRRRRTPSGPAYRRT